MSPSLLSAPVFFLASLLMLAGLGDVGADGADVAAGRDAGGRVMAAPEPLLGGECLACPDVDFGPFDPTSAWQLHASETCCAAGDCNTYAFDVEAGSTYEFATCAPGSADFDTVIELRDATGCSFLASNDDGCAGDESHVTWDATFTGQVHVTVRGRFGATGVYELAFREIAPCPEGTCSSPNGTLATPTTDCQTLTDVLDCGTTRAWDVELVQGQSYTFTTCDATCSGAGAAFDSRLELVRGGSVVAEATATCGDDGEIVFDTDPMTGGGPYCVRLTRESGAGGDEYTLGWRVSCQEPSDVAILPNSSSTVADDCSREQTFSVDFAGTGEFTLDWTITPLDGGAATPSAGTEVVAGNSATFTSGLVGAGEYLVAVTVTNDCGTDSASLTHVLRDTRGPDITCAVDPFGPPCPDPSVGTSSGEGAVSLSPDRAASLSLDTDEILGVAATVADAERAAEAIAAKLGLAPESVRVIDERRLDIVSPPGTEVLACASPCGSGILSASNPFYDVFVSCSEGSFTARTGASHSVTLSSGARQNVIYGGASASPDTSDISWRVHDTATTFKDPSGGAACVFDPPDTAFEPESIGLEQEWSVSPMAGVDLTLRQEVVAFGDVEASSGIRLTLGATNDAGSTQPVTMGVAWQIDYQNADDDGPLHASVECDPFLVGDSRSSEHDFTDAEIDAQDFYRIQNNTGDPIFGNFTSASAILGFPGTGRLDRLVYGHWFSLRSAGWNYVASEGANADGDSATLNYYGFLPSDGITIAPGESFRRSVVIFTKGEEQDCGSFVPGEGADASARIRQGDAVELSATGLDNCGPTTVTLIDSSPGAPPCLGNPCVVTFPDTGVFTYTWSAEDEEGNVTRCTSSVTVEACNRPPSCDLGPAVESSCREATIDAATAEDPDGDEITWSISSDDPNVTFSPASGVLPPGGAAQPLPPITVTLSPDVDPCAHAITATLTVDDGRGETSTCETTVLFDDTEAPSLDPRPADVTVECDAVPPPATVTVTDSCDGDPQLAFTETRIDGRCPGEYRLERAWTGTDACGNGVTHRQVVAVVDTTPPVVEASDEAVACLWPPNHRYVCMDRAVLGSPSISDACSEPVTWRIAGCVSSQPDEAPDGSGWNGDGRFADDCLVAPDGDSICVRSERAGAGPTRAEAQAGRTYGLAIVATDACGNESEPTVVGTIHVAHDQSPEAREGCLDPTEVGLKPNEPLPWE